MKAKRLIDVFKRQTRRTIWKRLDAMALDHTVYSTHVKGFGPHLKDYDVYLYANLSEVVVVCIDKYGEKDELADEGMIFDEPPLYFSSYGHRVSPVWQLSQAMKLMTYRLKCINCPAEVYGILLSNSRFANIAEMEDIWKEMGVAVIDRFRKIEDKVIEVNEDMNLAGKIIVDALLLPADGEATQGNTSNNAEQKDKEELSDDSNDAEQKDKEELSDDSNAELPDESDFPDDTLFFEEEISQNQNVTVKVDILRPIDNPYEELAKLVGCADIKQRMDELVALTSYNKMMRELFPNSKQHKISLHSVFLGRPGTGKTTVCKIFGSLLRKAGALSRGHVVLCDRGTFIGTLWGDEERSMRQVVDLARGGVLMIDEAYLLNGKNDNDPGKIVIQLLMNILSDESERDIAIVLCGYKEPMQKLLDSNPGLQSRFPNKFEFPDFTVDELLEITRRRVNEYEYSFTPNAWEKYCQLLSQAYQQRNPMTWGNARFITNQLERIYTQHAYRCVKQRPADKQQLRILTPEDILPIEVPKARQRIGF